MQPAVDQDSTNTVNPRSGRPRAFFFPPPECSVPSIWPSSPGPSSSKAKPRVPSPVRKSSTAGMHAGVVGKRPATRPIEQARAGAPLSNHERRQQNRTCALRRRRFSADVCESATTAEENKGTRRRRPVESILPACGRAWHTYPQTPTHAKSAVSPSSSLAAAVSCGKT